MKYISEFRKKDAVELLIKKIHNISFKEVNIMEICGTHTHSISKYGIRGAMPPNVKLLSGPGCPVCVTPEQGIDKIIEFASKKKDCIIATFGDMLRVPGSASTLEQEKANSDIRVIYSALDCLHIALANPEKEVVFYSVGFETTAPTAAALIIAAKEKAIRNLSVFSLNKLTPPAMKALLDDGDIKIHGFIAPGHVTAIIGAGAYSFIAKEYKAPCVVSGFEPVDCLLGILMLISQIEENRHDIEIEYKRVVKWEGNITAQRVLNEVFIAADAEWRGLGEIPKSGLKIREEFAEFDSEKKFDFSGVLPKGRENGPAFAGTPLLLQEKESAKENKGCACGAVLKGLITPPECSFFGNLCTPETPKGPCMVSSEGTCAAYYKYEGSC